MTRLPPKASRRLALALLAVALLLGYAGVVMPYVALYRGGVERVAMLEQRLAHYRAVAETRDAILDRLSAESTDPRLAANFISNETAALALADLQQHIKLAVGQSGAQLLSTQPMPISDDSDLLTATVRVGLRGDNESVQKLLYRLEGQRPIAHIDNVSLRALARTTNAARRNEQLDARFDLTGYVRLDTP